MGLEAEKEMKKWKKYKTMNAVKNNRIYILDSYQLCSPTVINFSKTLNTLMKLFNEKEKK